MKYFCNLLIFRRYFFMKIFKILILVLVTLGAALYLGGNFAARKLVYMGLAHIRPQLLTQGIEVHDLDYRTVQIRSPRSFVIREIKLDFSSDKALYDKQSFHASFTADKALVKIVNIENPSFLLELDDFSFLVKSNEDTTEGPFGMFEHAYWRGEAPLQLFGIEESGRLIMDRLKTLFRDNSIVEPVEFRGDVILSLDGKSASANLYTVRANSRTYLRINQEDILAAAEIFETEMAPATAALIAQYPARALHLIKITRDANRLSVAKGLEDPTFPVDAYKHIYWSYQITRAFGPEFAKTFTDTHETKPNNTADEREMDFRNNAFGRSYAVEGVREEQLIQRLLQDKRVIRQPADVPHKPIE